MTKKATPTPPYGLTSPRTRSLDRAPPAPRAVPSAARFLVLSSSVGSLATGFMLVFLPLYTLVGLGAAATLLADGPLADRYDRHPFLRVGMAVPIVGFALFAATTGYWWLVAASLLCNVMGAAASATRWWRIPSLPR